MCVQEGRWCRKHTASGAGPLGSTLGHRKDQDPPVSEGIPHTHVRVCAHTHVHARAYTYMCAHVCVHTCSYTHMHSRAYTHAHVCTHAYTGAYACMHAHTCAHTKSSPICSFNNECLFWTMQQGSAPPRAQALSSITGKCSHHGLIHAEKQRAKNRTA